MKPPFFWFLNLLDRNVIESEIKREKLLMKPPLFLVSHAFYFGLSKQKKEFSIAKERDIT